MCGWSSDVCSSDLRMVRQLTGFRIRERRRQLGLTQAGVAKRVGISGSYLNLIEANKRAVAGALLRRITELLDLDPETLTGHTEQRLIDDLTELEIEQASGRARLCQ